MANFNLQDLQFILQQIKIAEQHVENGSTREALRALVGSDLASLGLRTVDGSLNNLRPGREDWGAADQPFAGLHNLFPGPDNTAPSQTEFRDDQDGDQISFGDPDGPGGPAPEVILTNTDYGTPGNVVDADPRIISNLLVDMTTNNPAAVEAVISLYEIPDGAADIIRGHSDALQAAKLANDPAAAAAAFTALNDALFDEDVEFADLADGLLFIPNTAPDEGLSAPFNSWMTLFGQFFDHGLDLVDKGGNGTVYIPLQPDDPLYNPDSPQTNFMVLTRATPDGTNRTTSYVDQNQTYTSHPAHQVFLREYVMTDDGPVPTGELIKGANGGMATWADVKAQARNILGIELDDLDALSVPQVMVDLYGNFTPGANGFPQVILAAGGTAEGNPANPVDASLGEPTGHAFLLDIAHNATPGTAFDADGNPATPGTLVVQADDDTVAGNEIDTDFRGRKVAYDDELLDAHFMAGDGRANENIGLTAVHHVFHSEHNRLVDQTKEVVLGSLIDGENTDGDLAFLNEWLRVDLTQAQLDALLAGLDPEDLLGSAGALEWNGARIFQAAKFGTEMQYQHLVFEDFARKISPMIDIFVMPTGYDTGINASIVAEFAHTVYRFGHSMLTETIDRFSPTNQADHIGLIEAFLNPLEFDGGNTDHDIAAGAIIRGMTRQVGNEMDEFVTGALRDNLLGLPLDLATINLARGRDTGVPPLNAVRQDMYNATGDSKLKPYESWADFVQFLKHEASIVNFIAAYGTHETITSATTLAAKRDAAITLVETPFGESQDRDDFIFGTGDYAADRGGLNNVDLWIGGLAEKIMPFGGMLGSTFGYIFESQLESLQDGDRFYYLARTQSINFLSELEQNSFASLIVGNTDARHLPIDVFSVPAFTIEVDKSLQAGPDPTGGSPLNPVFVRSGNNLTYRGEDHVVLGGSDAANRLIGGIGDDTFWGDDGNDTIEGGFGNDNIDGGDGDDIITDEGGEDVIKGGDGNDVIHGGSDIDLLIGGRGKDYIVTGTDINEVFAGQGDDFILATTLDEAPKGNAGNDWMEGGMGDGAAGDNDDGLGLDEVTGHDVMVGNDGFNEMVMEGGDDIAVSANGNLNRYEAGSGFDWVIYKGRDSGIVADLLLQAFDETPQTPQNTALDRYESVEALSGHEFDDQLFGDNVTDFALPGLANENGARGSALNAAGIARIAGLQEVVGAGVTSFSTGNILLGGEGSDLIMGRGGDDIIDGDKWLNVRISVRQNLDGTGPEIATYDTMVGELTTKMLNRTYNPGQLVIVREIITPAANDAWVDTARYDGIFADYIVRNANGQIINNQNVFFDGGRITVEDADPAAGGVQLVLDEGTDTLTGIERVEFADFVLRINSGPTGAAEISDTSPTQGQQLTASLGNLQDAQGINASTLSFSWQAEGPAGNWVTVGQGQTFTPGTRNATNVPLTQAQINALGGPQVGQSLRLMVTYTDNAGNLETATMDVGTDPVGDFVRLNGGVQNFAGTDGADDVDTGGGNETLNGGLGNDTLNGGLGNDTLLGGEGNDSLLGGGNGGNDRMDGGAGDDTMTGGAGNDVYVNVEAGDTVVEGPGAGNDIVQTALNAFTLMANVEQLAFVGGVGDFAGTGNALNNRITGNVGNDTLDGGAGVDTMLGGAGDDTYIVDNAADVTTEAGGAGIDHVFASVSDTLQGNVENMTLTGNGAINGTGNALANIITGNGNNNTLNGAGGNDELIGLGGNDTISGAAGADTLRGGDGSDNISGGDGSDHLYGGAGNDVMNGNGGSDEFHFVLEGFGTDTINGFDAVGGGTAQDYINLEALGITATSFNIAVDITGGPAGTTIIVDAGGGELGRIILGNNINQIDIDDFMLA